MEMDSSGRCSHGRRLRELRFHLAGASKRPSTRHTALPTAPHRAMTPKALGGKLGRLDGCGAALLAEEDWPALRARLDEDGYLFLPGFHPREVVMKGRLELLQHLAAADRRRTGAEEAVPGSSSLPLLQPGAPLEYGVWGGGPAHSCGHAQWPGKGGDQRGVRPGFLDVVNSPKLLGFFAQLLGGVATTFDHKWVRVVPPGRGGSAHADIVYMSGGTRQLYTVWTPLGDVPLEMGPLAIALGSHKNRLLQDTYCAMDTHEYLSTSPDFQQPAEVAAALGCSWASADFAAGDILVFGTNVLHAPLTNLSEKVRLSSDTRYQLASEPQDSRHMGELPDVFPRQQGAKTLQQACLEWGLGPLEVEHEQQ
eukprot:SAG31_NODE_2800_length_5077_cov_2.098433_6_plen_366_part_00